MQSQTSAQPVPSAASEEVEELPSDIFTEPVDITKSKFSMIWTMYSIDVDFVLTCMILFNSYYIGTKITTSWGTSWEDKWIASSAQTVFSQKIATL